MKLYCGIYSSTISPLIKLRIECARVLYHKPDILMIDNAFSELKCGNSWSLFKSLITNLKGKCTIIFTSDSHRFVSFCTDYIFIEDGEVVTAGKRDELKEFEEFSDVQILDIELEGTKLQPEIIPKQELGDLNQDSLIRKVTRAMSIFKENSDFDK